MAAQAAGLGKIVVFSALGQPLRAEIEVSATREELSGMKAQLAPPEAFKQAGLDYATTLLGIRFSLDKRPNGQSVIKLSSDRPINDPFVDMLLELNWPAGRLVREYTFLLDPPEVTAKGSTPVAPATVRPAVTSKPTIDMRSTAPADIESRARTDVSKVRPQETVKKTADQPAEGSNVREVRRGDTLNRIASETKPEGVSLEQMLVGLLRANQEAFGGGNMNRLKAGKILSVPEKSAIEAVSTSEARRIVVAQSSDWNAYRSRLAGVAAQAPVKEEAARQEAAGKITAKVEDKAAPAVEPKDQLKVSKTETAAAKPGVAAKRSEEDLIAKEKALKEANERLASLEKNVAGLQKLIELKNQNLADLQKQATAKVSPVEVPKSVEEAKPQAPPPVPVPVAPPPKVEPAVAAVEKPVEKPAEPVPVVPDTKIEEVKPEPKAAETPKPVILQPPPPEEPGFVDGLLDNWLLLAGGGGILAAIAAFIVARRRRSGKEEVPLDLSSALSPQSMTANSVFRSTGGQSVDTSHTPAQTDFSQAGPGSIDTDEVDPVAEADVYMAYGRDAQAEEILLEARQKDPKRYAIHLKLLEIYSNRKDLKQFETLATDLYGETSGVGADWEKAAAMGLKLDPGNPLFGASAPAAPAAFDADATVIVSSQSMRNMVTLPVELSQLADVASTGEELSVPFVPVAADLTSLDFDLGLADEKTLSAPEVANADKEEALGLPEPAIDVGVLDFDLAADNSVFSDSAAAADATVVGLDFNLPDISEAATPVAETSNEVADLDFDLGIESGPSVEAESKPITESKSYDVPDVASVDFDGVEFDVSLTESTFLGQTMAEPSSFDMSSIDLDLNEPELAVTPSVPPLTEIQAESASDLSVSTFDHIQVSTVVNPDFQTEQAQTIVNPQFGDEQELVPEFDISVNEEVATKLDLAKAYEEMGDFEGARELLQEVLKEGDGTQREKAQAIFAKIGD
ncbi:FimV/HubP family polar landmark protein [Propionivibrio sp.]|uniref:FimV/HubP family polar landmark protein n=1 Tax=Propionivibrio sp. TaxID=2212460 RepID=UPI003BEF4F68